MKTLAEVDADLHTLRMIIKRAPSSEQKDLESARFHVFEAFDQTNEGSATRWILALKVGITTSGMAETSKTPGLAAIERLSQAVHCHKPVEKQGAVR